MIEKKYEVYMKKRFFLLAAALIALPVMATLTVEESTDPAYLYGHGHSQDAVDVVQMSKANVYGETYVPTEQAKYGNAIAPVRWIRKIFMYFDPALENGEFMQHDIKSSPNVSDL